jgi:hypothetical protein
MAVSCVVSVYLSALTPVWHSPKNTLSGVIQVEFAPQANFGRIALALP